MKIKEKIIEILLKLCASITIFTTIGIIAVLLFESIAFFKNVSILEFFTDTQWTPLFSEKHFGILSLVSGTFLTAAIAIAVALPIGLTIAIYLNMYAPKSFRKTLKPILEILAAIPTVVYGFFALTIVTPFLQNIYPDLETFNSLSAGLVMGIMIIPFISSLSEDALYAVPRSLREASYGMGATKLQTAFKVVVPAASSGIIVSIILAISRAIGETMIVVMAAGMAAKLTANPLDSVTTVTVQIVTLLTGDQEFDSPKTLAAFALGLMLFVVTLMLNIFALQIVKKYREQYE